MSADRPPRTDRVPLSLDDRQAAEVARRFMVLTDETRLLILATLAAGEMTAGAVCERVGLAPDAAGPHLSLMELTGLISRGRRGPEVVYSLAEGGRVILEFAGRLSD